MSKSEDALKALITFLDANGMDSSRATEALSSIKDAPSLDVIKRCNELGRAIIENKNNYRTFMELAEEFIHFYESHAEELQAREDFYLRVKRAYEKNMEQDRLVRNANEALEEEGYLR